MNDPDLVALREETLASIGGFNNQDVGAWMDPFHEDAVTHLSAVGFVPLAQIRPMADTLITTFKSFRLGELDGRRVGDTAILFGDYGIEYADGRTEQGRCSFTCAREGDRWKTLFTHYSAT